MLEDTEEDIFLIERELRQGGILFTSSIVKTRADFERCLHELNPDVVLSDHSLPQFNSIEALQIHKQYQLKTKLVVPFILITGSVSEEFAATRIKAGVDDYILKDRLTRLPAAIRSAIDKTRIERERMQFVDEIISNESMMKGAEQLAHCGSWTIDVVRGKYRWSDETYRIYGYEPGTIQLTPDIFLNHVHPDDKAFLKSKTDEAMRRLDPHPFEFRIIDRTGQIKHLLANITVVRDQNQVPIQVSGFNLDITHQKAQTDALATQNKRLMEIAWTQSHEVRGPLARLMGLINIIEDNPDDEGQLKEFLKHILTSAHELDSVIRRIVRKTEGVEGIDKCA